MLLKLRIKSICLKASIFRFVLLGLILSCLNTATAQGQLDASEMNVDLTVFEGVYQSQLNKFFFIQIKADSNRLTLKHLWNNKEISIEPKSDVEFFSNEFYFPIKFIKRKNEKIHQFLAFGTDLWDKVKNYKPTKEIVLPREKLLPLEGTYQASTDPKLRFQIIAKEGYILVKALWDGKEKKMVPETNLKFFSKEAILFLKFIKNKNGKVSQALMAEQLWNKIDIIP